MAELYSKFLEFFYVSLGFQQLAAILTVIGIPIIFFKLFFWRARHEIYFDPKETYHEVILVDRTNKPLSYWLQLMVKNNGYEISKNVEAYLPKILIKKDSKFQKLEEFRAPVKLKWSHEKGIFPIDILPKESRRLDICFICKSDPILYLMAESFPSGTIKNELPIGDYVFIIKVVSENSLTPATFNFHVVWNGRWKELKGDDEYQIKNFRIYNKKIKI